MKRDKIEHMPRKAGFELQEALRRSKDNTEIALNILALVTWRDLTAHGKVSLNTGVHLYNAAQHGAVYIINKG